MSNEHPTDALPLPDLPTTSYLGDGNGYGYDSSDMYAYGLIVRREGFELAMRALATPIHDPAVTTPREVLVGESPVDRIAAPAQQQAGAAEVSDEQIVTALESAGVEFQRFTGGLSGAQDIWTTAGSQRVKKIAAGVRAILALKAGGVA
jgi:hypothetical protein